MKCPLLYSKINFKHILNSILIPLGHKSFSFLCVLSTASTVTESSSSFRDQLLASEVFDSWLWSDVWQKQKYDFNFLGKRIKVSFGNNVCIEATNAERMASKPGITKKKMNSVIMAG